MSALRLINETTISSNTQSVNITDVFSSTYDAYKIVGTGFLLASSGGTNINLRLIDSSDNVISSGYVLAIHNLKSGGSFSDNNRGASKDNIFFYTIAPGFVETDRVKDIINDEIRAQSPLNRVAKPEEVAQTALWLASSGNDFLTGSIIDVNGASYFR